MHATLPPPEAQSSPSWHSPSEGAQTPSLLFELLNTQIIARADWDRLHARVRDELSRLTDRQFLLPRLVDHGLLTQFQCLRINAGKMFGLILGNYRVLDRLGAGGMGIVYKAEHLRLRRQVAIKVLAPSLEKSSKILQRFDGEIWAIAQLQHPNIVAAIDAGETPGQPPENPSLHYFVMEYVPGQNLEQFIEEAGPMSVFEACDAAYQVANALAEAHKHNLVHRDLKPSNLQRTPEGRIKLLDFGLAQHFQNRLTEPGVMLGTVDFMAPEQAKDARTVDIRADLYALGGTLYWCLTGQAPFAQAETTLEGLMRRQTQSPPSVRASRPEVPADLDAVIARMMAPKPGDRFPTPMAVLAALLPFIKKDTLDNLEVDARFDRRPPVPAIKTAGPRMQRVLIVDDEPGIRHLCRFTLQGETVECDEAGDGLEAMNRLLHKSYDLVILDIAMPVMDGTKVLESIRDNPAWAQLKVLMFSGHASGDEMSAVLQAGADDYLTKPFSAIQLRARARAALRLKEAQDRYDQLNRNLLATNQRLEQSVSGTHLDLQQTRNGLADALASLAMLRNHETRGHLLRIKRYARCLAEEASSIPALTDIITPSFLEDLDLAAPLHDIGCIGLPDHILLKPGKLSDEERMLMQTHAVLGAEFCQTVSERWPGPALGFLGMARDISCAHHERYDGQGYPDRLSGSDIPLAARIMAVVDVYDALRTPRVYKPALAHNMAVQCLQAGKTQFDPQLLQAFQRCHPQFERIFKELAAER